METFQRKREELGRQKIHHVSGVGRTVCSVDDHCVLGETTRDVPYGIH